MLEYSHGANLASRFFFHMPCGAGDIAAAYDANMPRKSATSDVTRPVQADWYLPEWMKTLKVSQAQLAKECDWTPSTMHGIYHGRTSYYRDILNLLASKLHIRPYELLMPPDLAMAFREFQASAQQIATLAHDADTNDAMQGHDFSSRRSPPARKELHRGTGTNG